MGSTLDFQMAVTIILTPVLCNAYLEKLSSSLGSFSHASTTKPCYTPPVQALIKLEGWLNSSKTYLCKEGKSVKPVLAWAFTIQLDKS